MTNEWGKPRRPDRIRVSKNVQTLQYNNQVISPANKVRGDDVGIRQRDAAVKRLDGNERIIKLIDLQAYGKGNSYLII
ncbi:hypothetical protein FRC07_012577, partial [Ceratobasidium sp. 392]